MALRVELERIQLETALQQSIASVKRAKVSARNPQFAALYDKDLATLQHAMNTITEVK